MQWDRNTIIEQLALDDATSREALLNEAYVMKQRTVGPIVYLRGLVEVSNMCSQDCFYCGIRKGNRSIRRYQMPEDDVIACAHQAHALGFGSLVLQTGERNDKEFVLFIERVVRKIKTIDNGALGITLSCGEQTHQTYQRWFDAGAHRYLLRIETSNRALYKKLHPEDQTYERRRACLSSLRSAGYQTGTGVMIGLPGQTIADLADDILFFKEHDVDMIGMGPYLRHAATPLAQKGPAFDAERLFALSCTMIALTRLVLKDVNIAATTALETLHPQGRQAGLRAGANVIMPNLTPKEYRSFYELYENKSSCTVDETGCFEAFLEEVRALGETVGYRAWGDAPHYARIQWRR